MFNWCKNFFRCGKQAEQQPGRMNITSSQVISAQSVPPHFSGQGTSSGEVRLKVDEVSSPFARVLRFDELDTAVGQAPLELLSPEHSRAKNAKVNIDKLSMRTLLFKFTNHVLFYRNSLEELSSPRKGIKIATWAGGTIFALYIGLQGTLLATSFLPANPFALYVSDNYYLLITFSCAIGAYLYYSKQKENFDCSLEDKVFLIIKDLQRLLDFFNSILNTFIQFMKKGFTQQQAQIDALTARIDTLETQNKSYANMLRQLSTLLPQAERPTSELKNSIEPIAISVAQVQPVLPPTSVRSFEFITSLNEKSPYHGLTPTY